MFPVVRGKGGVVTVGVVATYIPTRAVDIEVVRAAHKPRPPYVFLLEYGHPHKEMWTNDNGGVCRTGSKTNERP